jgi:Zn-dependent peptidase ImmA (M78 family)
MEQVKLNELQLDEIRKLASEKRQSLGFVGRTPIANDIFMILEKLDIVLLEYPIKSECDRPAFSAAIMYSEVDNKEQTFIGLNTADYYDKQIFAIAHELYHYYTKTGLHITRLDDLEYNLIEVKANRFAAEFLLPRAELQSIILEDFKKTSLVHVSRKMLLRFIARLHCTWWLPYRSLVRRLYEIGTINSNQYDELYTIPERDVDSEYGKICYAFNREVFQKLNTVTRNIGTSPKAIEVIIRNFEDNLIDEDKFAETLSIFKRTPDEFGYDIKISQ